MRSAAISLPRDTALRTRLLAVAVVLAAATALVGCTSNGGSSSTGGAPDVQQVAPGDGEIAPREETSNDDRAVVSTASVSLTSPKPEDAIQQVVDITTDATGRVDSRTDSPATLDSPASGSLTVRIPADRLDETLTKIKAVAELRHSSLNATDVTDQVTDLDARVTALRASVGRLLALIAKATSTTDLIALESALSERQAELDSLEAQRDTLGDAVEYATVHVDISSPGAVAGAAPGDFWGGIVVGFTALISFFSGLLVVLGILLPWALLLAIVAVVVLLILRRRRDHRAPPSGDPHKRTSAEPSGPPSDATALETGAIPPRPSLPVEHTRSTPAEQTPETPG